MANHKSNPLVHFQMCMHVHVLWSSFVRLHVVRPIWKRFSFFLPIYGALWLLTAALGFTKFPGACDKSSTLTAPIRRFLVPKFRDAAEMSTVTGVAPFRTCPLSL